MIIKKNNNTYKKGNSKKLKYKRKLITKKKLNKLRSFKGGSDDDELNQEDPLFDNFFEFLKKYDQGGKDINTNMCQQEGLEFFQKTQSCELYLIHITQRVSLIKEMFEIYQDNLKKNNKKNNYSSIKINKIAQYLEKKCKETQTQNNNNNNKEANSNIEEIKKIKTFVKELIDSVYAQDNIAKLLYNDDTKNSTSSKESQNEIGRAHV